MHLRSYSIRNKPGIPATISQAACATSAATTFFKPVSIGARKFVDGTLGAKTPWMKWKTKRLTSGMKKQVT